MLFLDALSLRDVVREDQAKPAAVQIEMLATPALSKYFHHGARALRGRVCLRLSSPKTCYTPRPGQPFQALLWGTAPPAGSSRTP